MFDGDGVLMNSNKIKEDAFAKVAQIFYEEAAVEAIRIFHRKNGGYLGKRNLVI